MVTVNKLKINGFGRFSDRSFSLTPGLNVVFGGNEAGKSTIHSFIEAMLFGFGKANLAKDEKQKYRPWQVDSFGGEIEYTWSGGNVKVIRDFNADKVKLIDCANGEELEIPLNGNGEPDYARIHFGCSKLVFRNTISISQLGSATDSAVAMELRNLLSNLAQSGGSGISVKRGLEALAEAKRQTEFELVKTRALLERLENSLEESKNTCREAAKLEIDQYRSSRRLEDLINERRNLKELRGKIQGQVAAAKLDRLANLRRRKQSILDELNSLGDISIDPGRYQQWLDLQSETDRVRELEGLHAGALEEADNRSRHIEGQIQELSTYANFDKDTLIEMSSAWQMQTKSQQVIEDLQRQLESIGVEIRELTSELAKLPYFRPDALEQAAALQAQAGGVELQSSHEDMEIELTKHQRLAGVKRNFRGVLVLLIPCVAVATFLLEQPFLALIALPLLLGAIASNSSVKKHNLRSRNLRREIYTVELEHQSSLRQREQAQRELSNLLGKAGATSLRELERKYNDFIRLSDRNKDLLREQKFLSGKLENYLAESETKSIELHQILSKVGLGEMPIDSALACFRVNLDKLLDLKVYLEQSRQQKQAAQQRWEQTRAELARLEAQAQAMLEGISVASAAEVESMAQKYNRRQELDHEMVSLDQRIQDLLQGVSEASLLQQAELAPSAQLDDVEDLPQRIEMLDEKILEIQSGKSEGTGRLEGLYSALTSPAELEEELWQVELRHQSLQQDMEAIDLAAQTIEGLANELNSQLAPELNHMVSTLVQRITGGKYYELQVARDMSISVSTPENGEMVDLDRLSGGTVDQFYFACRVAIADLVTGGGLPLFLDDSFVQYDDHRLGHMLDLLVELGKSRQIILLTCQQRELEQLAKLAHGHYTLINLDN